MVALLWAILALLVGPAKMRIVWHVDQHNIAPQQRDMFDSMDTLLQAPAQRITLDARSGVSRLCLQHNYYIKVFNGPANRLQHLLGIGRYQRELRNLRYFAELGLATPALAAYGHRYHRGLLHDAVMVTREVTGAVDLEKLTQTGQLYARGVAGARNILDKLALAARSLHARGFYHGDLKARNILVRDAGGEPELFFFDCPRGYHPPRFMLRRCIVRDLAHLEHDLRAHVRKADLLYCYRQYRGATKLSDADKALARDALGYYERRSMTRKRRRRIAAKQRQYT
jgi:tRNA A-37 threonylcarbamoyl transferase component Bud32